MSTQVTRDEEALEHYRVYRRRLEEYLHLALLWIDVSNGERIPDNILGHGKEEFASTLRTVMLGWLASFVDRRKDSLNVFELWLKLFPNRAAEIEEVRDRVKPLFGKLKAFRDKVAFHADRQTKVHDSVRLALVDPALAEAQDSFLELAISLLREESKIPGLSQAVHR